jgi:OmpA-OmpF porin, OOP family
MKISRIFFSIATLLVVMLLTGLAHAQNFSRDDRFSPHGQSEEPKRPELRKKLNALKDQIERKVEEPSNPAPVRPQPIPSPKPLPQREPIHLPVKPTPSGETESGAVPDSSSMIARLRGQTPAPRPNIPAAPQLTPAPAKISTPSVASGVPMTSSPQATTSASQGATVTPPIVSSNGVTILERKSRVAVEAMPQGYLPSQGGSAVLYSKQSHNPAIGTYDVSGQAPPASAQMKQNHNPAEGLAEGPSGPYPTIKSSGTGPQGLPSDNLANGGTYFPPAGNSGGYSAYSAQGMPSEISYKVDANSQLSTSAVKFLKGSIELADQASYQYLVNLSAALQAPELAPFRFVVEGHASAEGADYANFLLSQRRANAIFGFLTSRGVSPQRLLAVGHGETYARFGDHEPDYLRAEDRQVVVFKLAE